MLVFFDAWGKETGKFKFPSNPPPGLRTLLATEEFAKLPGAPAPDVRIPPLLNALNGGVCFRSNPSNGSAAVVETCLSYGRLSGNAVPGGGPAASPLPITGTASLRRTGDSGRSSDFAINDAPAPSNSAGATLLMRPASLEAQGRALFENETFSGNGRTCAACHVAADGFALTPANVQARFAALTAPASSFDPLFIGESAPSAFDLGFDFNLNTLELDGEVETGSPCSGELRGLLTTVTGGRAKVLARTGPTTYLVYGGLNPPLEGPITDGICAAAVSGIVAGDLAPAPDDPGRRGIEDAPFLRRTSPEFPDGRALILENIDGYSNPPVLRRSPPLLNLRYSAPYGHSGGFPDLRSFTTAAVIQHFPRTLSRTASGPNPDFRLPTTEELDAIEAFLLAQESPAGNDPNKFDLSRFATTSVQRKGRDDFEVFGCAACHSGLVLSQTAISVQEKPAGVNASFNTGTAAGAFGETLPCERGAGSCGSREFSTPQLFGLPGAGLLFHNGTATTLAEAVSFYDSSEFVTSPTGLEFISMGIPILATDAITAFLEGLVTRPYTIQPQAVRFGAQRPDAGRTAALSIVVTNTGSRELRFRGAPCRLEGPQAGEFTLVACPLQSSLAAGERRTLQVAFAPQSDGLKSAILEIHPEEAPPSGIDLFGVGGPLGPPPRISGVRGQSGSSAGGETLTIQGANFLEGAAIAIGGVDGAYVRVVTPATISVRTPPHPPGTVRIEVVNPDGQTAQLPNAYTYLQ
jgi:cytochrome c peroxidase